MLGEPVERGARIVNLSDSSVMGAGRTADTTEVEPQATDAVVAKRLRDSVGDVVVHRPAKKRMRVAHHRGRAGMFNFPPQRLEAAINNQWLLDPLRPKDPIREFIAPIVLRRGARCPAGNDAQPKLRKTPF